MSCDPFHLIFAHNLTVLACTKPGPHLLISTAEHTNMAVVPKQAKFPTLDSWGEVWRHSLLKYRFLPRPLTSCTLPWAQQQVLFIHTSPPFTNPHLAKGCQQLAGLGWHKVIFAPSPSPMEDGLVWQAWGGLRSERHLGEGEATLPPAAPWKTWSCLELINLVKPTAVRICLHLDI